MPIELFVNGTLMRGLALHHNLAGAEFLGAFRTAPVYRLYSIGDIHPGMFEVETGGVSVTGEFYRMSDEVWRRVEEGEPPHLYRGPVTARGRPHRRRHPLSPRARRPERQHVHGDPRRTVPLRVAELPV